MLSSHEPMLRLVVVVSCAALAVALTGCGSDSTIRVSGRVADDVIAVQAPSLPTPRPNPGAGFPESAAQGDGTGAMGRSAVSTITALTGLGSVSRVATVSVSLGQTVAKGDVLAEFDAAALDAAIAAARAEEHVARAQVGVLSDAIDRTDSAESKLAANRRTLKATVAQLAETRAQLAERLAQLEALLAQLKAMPGSARGTGSSSSASSAATTGTTPPGTPPKTGPSTVEIGAMIAQLEAAIVKIDAGLVKAQAGLSRLASAGATLADARVQLGDVRVLARVAAGASAIGVRVAQYQRSLATVRAPASGAIVRVASIGDVLAPGATVAEIRDASIASVQTWLAPDDLPRVAEGDRVYVYGDWFASGAWLLRGHITRIGQRADYPPSSFATKDVHLTRALPVEITLDGHPGTAGYPSAETLPPGAPVDVTILPKTAPRP